MISRENKGDGPIVILSDGCWVKSVCYVFSSVAMNKEEKEMVQMSVRCNGQLCNTFYIECWLTPDISLQA